MGNLRDVVATKRKGNHALALAASLPALLVSKLQRLLQSFILGTIPMVLCCLAHGASGRVACRASGKVVGDVDRPNKLRASRVGAIDTLAGGSVELFFLLLELGGEFGVDTVLDVFPWHWLTAAPRWIQRLLGHASAVELL